MALTPQQIYTNYLNSLPNLLQQFMFDIYDVLSNLAMAGELSDVNSGFDISCELMFMIDDFRNLNDQNVQILYHIYDFIHDKRASIRRNGHLWCFFGDVGSMWTKMVV